MRQYRITTENLNQSSEDDAYLAPDDPIHELKIVQYLNGLGAEARLAEYRARKSPINNENNTILSGSEKRQYERDHNIKPGDPAWFELWFGHKQ